MKKISLILAFMLMVSTFSVQAAQDTIVDKADKYITISHSVNWKSGETITLAIVNVSGIKNSGRDITWDELTERAINNPEIITYYDTGIVNENVMYKNGECELNIVLEKSGIYKCFLSNQSGDTDVFYINHIDKEKQKNTADSIINACENKDTAVDNIANILKSNTYDIGFADDLYSNVVSGANNNESNVSKYIYEYVCGDRFSKNDKNYIENLCGAILRAFCAEALNMGIISDLYDVEYAMGVDSLELRDFVKKEHADILNKKMMSKKYTSVSEYDKALAETFTGLVIQYNDGSGEIPKIIKKFADLSGVDTSMVTTSFCNSIAGSDKYYSFEELKKYANSYVEPKSESVKGGGGSSGGGNKFNSIKADNDVMERNDTMTSVNIFTDVPKEHWANSYIEALYKEGTVSGVTTTEYKPEDNITREEFVKLIVSALKLNTVGNDAPFLDVDKNAWYYNYINIAYNSNIINGITETEFGTGENIIRQDIAVIVANSLKELDYNFNSDEELTFEDSASIDEYAKNSVKLLKNSGILNGDENNLFNPKSNATRAEAAKIIYMISR